MAEMSFNSFNPADVLSTKEQMADLVRESTESHLSRGIFDEMRQTLSQKERTVKEDPTAEFLDLDTYSLYKDTVTVGTQVTEFVIENNRFAPLPLVWTNHTRKNHPRTSAQD